MFYSSAGVDTRQIQLAGAICAFGNCTWEHVSSLSVCSKCADVSSYIDESEEYYTLNLYDLYMRRDIGLIVSVGDTLYPDNTVLQDIGPLIVHWSAIVRDDVNNQPVGIDCAMYWCVMEQNNVTMTNFNVTDQVITYWTDVSASAQTEYKQTTDITLTPDTCFDQFGIAVDTTLCTKTVSDNAQLALQNFFTSDVIGFTGSASWNVPTHGWNISTEFIQLLFSTIPKTNDIVGSYLDIIGKIGYFMTQNMRLNINTPQGEFPSSFGRTYFWTTVYDIRWGFLVLPTILVVGSILFLLVAIFKSWGQEKWKSSLLPLLFHPLKERPGVAPHKMSEITAVAENKEVRLERSHLGSQFV
jgi:hypothetical protein